MKVQNVRLHKRVLINPEPRDFWIITIRHKYSNNYKTNLSFATTLEKIIILKFLFCFRGTFGGCFATTLGGLIHELGHMLDLGHTDNGMMSRGCDDVDKFFTLSTSQSNTTEGKSLAQKQRQLLANCSR